MKFVKSLYFQILFAVLLGVLVGHFWSQQAIALKPLGDAFIKLIKMLIGLIVFCVVVSGISGAGDLKKVGRIGLKSVIYFEVLTTIALVIGLGACIVTMMIPIATWQRLGWLMLIGAFGLLVMVIIPGIGREVNGSMRWIGFGAFNVQPSEIAKVFVVIYLAGYLVRRQKEVRESWMGFFKPFIVLLPMAGLLLMEPDFGATVVMMGAAVLFPVYRDYDYRGDDFTSMRLSTDTRYEFSILIAF